MAQTFRLGHAEEQVVEARKRVAEQKAKLERLIAKGAPTQAAEDLLCKLHEALKRLTRHARSSG
jgi:4-aminobutyrate aminotransferase-like enzyme